MAARSGIVCLALAAAVAFLLPAAPAHPWPAAPSAFDAGDEPAVFERDGSDAEDDLSPQDGMESAASSASSPIRPPFASAAVLRSGDDPPSFEYRSGVFRPPAS